MKYTSLFPLGIAIPLFACSVPLQATESVIEPSTSDESTPLLNITRKRWW